jgi:Fic family protein
MKIEEFKAGTYRQQLKYKSFLPVKINHEWTWTDPSLNVLLEEATRRVGELNAFASFIPNIDLFIETHCTKEAQLSSKIEGTLTDFQEALFPENNVSPERRDDWQEVQNYIHAMNFAINKLESLPLSNRLLRQAHEKLLDGVRGKHKSPGQFRNSQNWIGGASLNDAVFIPPHHTDIPDLMADLENFLHNDTIKVPYLIRAAISHYHFETIHPFLDGNGRIGRLLITLYFVSTGLLSKPTLYLSDFFERNKYLYYDNLTRVRTHNDLLQWIKFFLVGISETAAKGIKTFQNIMALRDDIEGKRILKLRGRAEKGKALVNLLYKYPVIDAGLASSALKSTPATISTLFKEFQRLEILRETTGFKRNRIFVFQEYIDCFERD